MAGPAKGARSMKKKPMPNQGIGSASFKSNLKGKRKLRAPNAEPHAPGKDFLPSKAGAARVAMMKRKGLKTLERKAHR